MTSRTQLSRDEVDKLSRMFSDPVVQSEIIALGGRLGDDYPAELGTSLATAALGDGDLDMETKTGKALVDVGYVRYDEKAQLWSLTAVGATACQLADPEFCKKAVARSFEREEQRREDERHSRFAAEVNHMLDNGYLVVEDGKYRITDRGVLFDGYSALRWLTDKRQMDEPLPITISRLDGVKVSNADSVRYSEFDGRPAHWKIRKDILESLTEEEKILLGLSKRVKKPLTKTEQAIKKAALAFAAGLSTKERVA